MYYLVCKNNTSSFNLHQLHCAFKSFNSLYMFKIGINSIRYYYCFNGLCLLDYCDSVLTRNRFMVKGWRYNLNGKWFFFIMGKLLWENSIFEWPLLLHDSTPHNNTNELNRVHMGFLIGLPSLSTPFSFKISPLILSFPYCTRIDDYYTIQHLLVDLRKCTSLKNPSNSLLNCLQPEW